MGVKLRPRVKFSVSVRVRGPGLLDRKIPLQLNPPNIVCTLLLTPGRRAESLTPVYLVYVLSKYRSALESHSGRCFPRVSVLCSLSSPCGVWPLNQWPPPLLSKYSLSQRPSWNIASEKSTVHLGYWGWTKSRQRVFLKAATNPPQGKSYKSMEILY